MGSSPICVANNRGEEMPKIKMFETNLQNSYEQYETIVSGVTQWEDVTVDELKALEYWVTNKNKGVL